MDDTLLCRIDSGSPAYCSKTCQTDGWANHWQVLMTTTERSVFTPMLVHLGQLQKYKQTRKIFLPKNSCSHDETCIACNEIFKWYRFGAEQDAIDHQVGLAICYLYGIGVPKSSVEAAVWFGKAAATGNEFAIQSLKTMFQKLEAICKLNSILEENDEKEETDDEDEEDTVSDPV